MNRNERTTRVFQSIAKQKAAQDARIAALEAEAAEYREALDACVIALESAMQCDGGWWTDDHTNALFNARAILAKYPKP